MEIDNSTDVSYALFPLFMIKCGNFITEFDFCFSECKIGSEELSIDDFIETTQEVEKQSKYWLVAIILNSHSLLTTSVDAERTISSLGYFTSQRTQTLRSKSLERLEKIRSSTKPRRADAN